MRGIAAKTGTAERQKNRSEKRKALRRIYPPGNKI